MSILSNARLHGDLYIFDPAEQIAAQNYGEAIIILQSSVPPATCTIPLHG